MGFGEGEGTFQSALPFPRSFFPPSYIPASGNQR